MTSNKQILQQTLAALQSNYQNDLAAAKQSIYTSDVQDKINELKARAEVARKEIESNLNAAIQKVTEEKEAECTNTVNEKYASLFAQLQELIDQQQ